MEKQGLKKRYQVEGYRMVFQMPEELDHHVAQQLCKELDMLVEAYQINRLVLDFEKTSFMDSSGIGVVIGRSNTMRYREGTLEAINLGRRVQMIFASAGLNKLITVKGE